MIGYVTLGTNNFKKSVEFYDQLLAEMGAKRIMEGDNFVAWGHSMDRPSLGIIKPYNKLPATWGNGTMVALAADAPATVDKIYKKAIALGAADEGAAGPRGDAFYAGYFRDPDGNKLNVFCMTAKK